MSSFLVSHECITKILSFNESNNQPLVWGKDAIPPTTKSGRMLIRMNLAAVEDRYPVNEVEDDEKPREKYNYEYHKTTPIEALKAMQCLSYQCNEGTVPRRKLYKKLELLCSSLAMRIAEDSNKKEFEAAKWG